MTLWMIRADKYGKNEDILLNQNIITIKWQLGNLTNIKSKNEVKKLLKEKYSDEKDRSISLYSGLIWMFIKEMKNGDLIAFPLKKKPEIAIGVIVGEYAYNEDDEYGYKQTRKVKWLLNLKRIEIDQDILNSLGSYMSLCRISRNNSEKRLKRLLINKGIDFLKNENMIQKEKESSSEIKKYVEKTFTKKDYLHLYKSIIIAKGYTLKPINETQNHFLVFSTNSSHGRKMGLYINLDRTILPSTVVETVIDYYLEESYNKIIFISWDGFGFNLDLTDVGIPIEFCDSFFIIEQYKLLYNKITDFIRDKIPLKSIKFLSN